MIAQRTDAWFVEEPDFQFCQRMLWGRFGGRERRTRKQMRELATRVSKGKIMESFV